MCGLIGQAGTLEKPHLQMQHDLLIMDMVRGRHGTGLGTVSRSVKDNVDYLKIGSHAIDLIEQRRFDNILSLGKKVLIGHNRFATRGSHTSANAHPYMFDHVIGAHNGTLDWAAQRRFEADEKDFGTDSEHFYYNINELGLKEAVSRAEGAWALTYYDKRDNTINLLRNEKRPLYYGILEGKKVIVWASEAYMIRAAAERAGVRVDKLYELPVDTHFKMGRPEFGKEFAEEVREQLKGTVLPPFVPGSWRGGALRREERRKAHASRPVHVYASKQQRDAAKAFRKEQRRAHRGGVERSGASPGE